MPLLLHLFQSRCSYSLLRLPAFVSSNRRFPITCFSTDTAFINDKDVVKPKPSARNALSLKKRSFTYEEQRSNFGKLVYRAPAEAQRWVFWTKLFSLQTSIASFVLTPWVIWTTTASSGTTTSTTLLASVVATFGSVFVFTPLFLDQLTKRFVLEMYYNGERDLYTTVSYNIFARKRALTFSVNDAIAVNGAFTTHAVGKNKILLLREGYTDHETQYIFESMFDRLLVDDENVAKDEDDDANDEPAKATTDHHKRQQDQ